MNAAARLSGGGFAAAARQAWGITRAGDPDIDAWLIQSDFFGETRHGVAFLAPKLYARWKRGGDRTVLEGRFRGLLRHRAAANAVRARILADAVSALHDAGDVLIAGGWPDCRDGAPLHEASLQWTEIALEAYDAGRVAQALRGQGWEARGDHWQRRLVLGEESRMSLYLSVARRLRIGEIGLWQDMRDPVTGEIHLPPIDRIVAQAADLGLAKMPLWVVRQQLDRLEGLIAHQPAIALPAIIERARQLGMERPVRSGLLLLPDVAGGGFDDLLTELGHPHCGGSALAAVVGRLRALASRFTRSSR